MTDFLTDDLETLAGSTGSISHASVFHYGSATREPQKIVSYKRPKGSSICAHQIEEAFDETGLEALDTFVIRQGAVDAGESLVMWTEPKGCYVKNLVIALSGAVESLSWLEEAWLPIEYADRKPKAVRFSEDVVEFCYEKHMLLHLEMALRIAMESFKLLEKIEVSLVRDNDSGDQWVEISVRVNTSPEDFLTMYDNYMSRLISIIPSSARDKMHLVYDIV